MIAKFQNNIRSKLHGVYKKHETNAHHLQYVFLEITRRCNLNCLHCGSDCKKETRQPELTTDSWLKIIDYLKERFSQNIAFVITGGEPLMNNDIYTIGAHIHNRGMRWGMVTNGMLLNNQNMDKLIKAGLSSITLSIDGLNDSHNWLRNNEYAFTKSLSALQLIVKSRLKYSDVVTCVSPANLKELDKIADLLLENEVKNWRLFRIFPSGRAKNDKNLQLSFEQTREMLDWIKNNRQVYKQKGLSINLSCEGWVKFEDDIKLRDFPFFCRSGINIASILADGTITGCSNNDKGFHAGNILHDNFANLWENHFDIFRKKEWLNQTICADCKHFKSCRGGSVHLWEMGDSAPKFCYEVDLSKTQNAR